LVFNIVLEGRNRYTVGQLCAEGINCIVNNNHVFQIAILEYTKVFNVYIVSCFDAVISVHSVLDQLTFRIDIVEDNICVPPVAGGKNYDFKILIDFFKALSCVGAYVKPRLQDFSRLQLDI